MADYSSIRRPRISGATLGKQGRTEGDPAIGADHLAYIADMVAEFQEIAERGGYETLATILGLAETEALRQAAEASSLPPR